MVAVWTELLQGTQSVLQSLGLTYLDGAAVVQSLPAERVYRRRVVNDRNATLPCLIVAPGDREIIEPGTFEDTEVVYPVLVVHEFPSNQDLTPNNDELLWRQKMLDAMVEWEGGIRPLVNAAVVTECDVDTDPIIDRTLFQQANVDVGGMLLRFRTLRGRGRG